MDKASKARLDAAQAKSEAEARLAQTEVDRQTGVALDRQRAFIEVYRAIIRPELDDFAEELQARGLVAEVEELGFDARNVGRAPWNLSANLKVKVKMGGQYGMVMITHHGADSIEVTEDVRPRIARDLVRTHWNVSQIAREKVHQLLLDFSVLILNPPPR